jgi:glucan 1,3-beta-glucosidase
MRLAVLLFVPVAVAVAAFWTWLGAPVAMPASPLSPGEKMYCVSYAPFRGAETPHDPNFTIPPERIDEDMRQLAKISRCVRTYATELGLDRLPEIAGRHGLKVLQGIWISSKRERNQLEIETAIDLAKRFPQVIEGLIVGNEVLLRGELSGDELTRLIRAINDRVEVPVTYADVWEFWEKHPQVATAVDFITIHILPYWEDFPIPAAEAARHVDNIKQKVQKDFPGREIIIGETGWPSTGRMREGALPSPSNQARVIQEILAIAEKQGYRVNVIEAFDQPWKRKQEGVVGGHWGFITAAERAYKFEWGKPVSDHPYWPFQAVLGVVLVGLTFAAGLWGATRRTAYDPTLAQHGWGLIAAVAFANGAFAGWMIEAAIYEAQFVVDYVRLGLLGLVAIGAPLAVAALVGAGLPAASLAEVFARPGEGRAEGLPRIVGLMFAVAVVIGVAVTLGQVFDPRYREFPFQAFIPIAAAALAAALVQPFGRLGGGAAEITALLIVLPATAWIVFAETAANTQALAFVAAISVFALALVRIAGGRQA